MISDLFAFDFDNIKTVLLYKTSSYSIIQQYICSYKKMLNKYNT